MKSRSHYRLLFGAAALAITAASAQAALADITPASVTAVVVDTVGGSSALCSSSGSFNCKSLGPASATALDIIIPKDDIYSGSGRATVLGSPEPALGTSASIFANQLVEGGGSPVYVAASAFLTYSFDITPTDPTIDIGSVPVLVNGSFSQSLTTGDENEGTMSSVMLSITGPGGATLYGLSNLGTDKGGLFSGSFDLTPGVEYTVSMSASATATISANEDEDEGRDAAASIDPLFTVDPKFDLANDFQFNFSSGVGNSAMTVPEPATWAMMLVGFGGLGAAMRRRRRARTSATAA